MIFRDRPNFLLRYCNIIKTLMGYQSPLETFNPKDLYYTIKVLIKELNIIHRHLNWYRSDNSRLWFLCSFFLNLNEDGDAESIVSKKTFKSISQTCFVS